MAEGEGSGAGWLALVAVAALSWCVHKDQEKLDRVSDLADAAAKAALECREKLHEVSGDVDDVEQKVEDVERRVSDIEP